MSLPVWIAVGLVLGLIAGQGMNDSGASLVIDGILGIVGAISLYLLRSSTRARTTSGAQRAPTGHSAEL